jgi:hypothetical protein
MSSSFIYALIAREPDIVLTEYTKYKGNFIQLIRVILTRKPKTEIKGEIEYDEYTITFDSEDNLIFLLLSENVPSKIAFQLLSDIRRKIYELYSYSIIMNSTTMQIEDFNVEIQKILDHYSTQPSVSIYGELIEVLHQNTEEQTIKNEKLSIDEYIPPKQRVRMVVVDLNRDSGGGLPNIKQQFLSGSNVTALNISSGNNCYDGGLQNGIIGNEINCLFLLNKVKYLVIAGGIVFVLIFGFYIA